MTGRGLGHCVGYDAPGYASPMPGRGFSMGRGRGGGWGRGRGRRNWYYATGLPGWARFGYAPAWGAPPAAPYGPYAAPPAAAYFQQSYGAPPTPAQEVEFLKAQAEGLKEQLDAISQRITELEQGE